MAAAAAEGASVYEEEELEVMPTAEKERDPFFRARIRRTIDGTEFAGVIDEIDIGRTSGDILYLVHYEDGDVEHLTRDQVLECQDTTAVAPAALEQPGGPTLPEPKRQRTSDLAKKPAQAEAEVEQPEPQESAPKSRAKAKSKAQAQGKPKAAPKAKAQAQSKAKAKAKAAPKAKAKAKGRGKARAAPKAKAKAKAQSKAQSKAKAKAVAKKPAGRK